MLRRIRDKVVELLSPSQPPHPVGADAASDPRTLALTRAFTAADLAPLPEGWALRPPDFVGVGTEKAGTAWWHSLIDRHPAVVANRLGIKELRYFCHFGTRRPSAAEQETYRAAFAAPPG